MNDQQLASVGRDAPEMVLGVAWYEREQWDRLREISADYNSPDDTYERWQYGVKKSLEHFDQSNLILKKVFVDVDELVAWCRTEDRAVDGAARSIFTAMKLRQIVP